ncbi:MAG: pyrimidine/purine nucleoside phosphorylase [Candidatus Cloacimonetes bacterium]|nr:pyrimidine/purine nucleoside phosphorylase [Candidatus Cloacimonadota bacterium]
MFKVNEYYNGKVKSLAFDTQEGPATIGVMAPGEYEFGTSTIEHMTITSGEMQVMQPGESTWKTYKPFETFIVAENVKFKVKLTSNTSYLCLYK